MKHLNLAAVMMAAVYMLAGDPMIASAADKGGDKVKRDVEELMKSHGSAKVATAFADLGLVFPKSAGYRGLQYSEYLFDRSCWIRGPQAGLIRNDNCITYKAKCKTGDGGSKVTVTKISGDMHIRVFNSDREVFVCEATIHLPQEESLTIGFTPGNELIKP